MDRRWIDGLHQADRDYRHERDARELRQSRASAHPLRARRGARAGRRRMEAERLPAVRGRLRRERPRDGSRRRDDVRNGQAGVVQMGVAKKLEGNATHPINQGGAVRARPGGDPDHLSPRSHHAAAEAHRRARRGAVRAVTLGRGDRASWSRSSTRWRGRTTRSRWRSSRGRVAASAQALVDAVPAKVRRAGRRSSYELFGDDVLRRANRSASAASSCRRSISRARASSICFGADFLGTWNSPVAQSARLRRDAAGAPGRARRVRAGRAADVADRRERRRMGAGQAGHRRRARARPRARDPRATSCGRPTRGRAGASIDGWSRRPRRLRARRRSRQITGVAAAAHRAARARARRARSPRSRSPAARRSRTPTASSPRSPSTR